ncbi:MAG: exostosin family protein [Marinirhabdus sp.]|nr:exostosin family protein [Marinirhabdus sp.]
MIQVFVCGTIHPKRAHVFPLLKPFEKTDGYTDAQRHERYGISEKELNFVTQIEEADVVVLPMSWNFYHATQTLEIANSAVQAAQVAQKPVVSFVVGDFGVKVPYFDNLVVFRTSGNRSSLPNTHRGLPVFIKDPLKNIYDTKDVFLRHYTPQPTVGFCGQANGNSLNALIETGATLARNMKSYLGVSPTDPQTVMSTSHLRASILQLLEGHDQVNTRFIRRKKYRAGATTETSRKKTTQEFYDNMKDSDYVVCVRGAGNFSVRLYETLAMGRIPVFVDTDCLLPLRDHVDWKQHVVWVDYKDRKQVAEKVITFHQALSEHQFEAMQRKNRALWKDKLTLGGFFKSFVNELD